MGGGVQRVQKDVGDAHLGRGLVPHVATDAWACRLLFPRDVTLLQPLHWLHARRGVWPREQIREVRQQRLVATTDSGTGTLHDRARRGCVRLRRCSDVWGVDCHVSPPLWL